MLKMESSNAPNVEMIKALVNIGFPQNNERVAANALASLSLVQAKTLK
jgi:hypothetical protein